MSRPDCAGIIYAVDVEDVELQDVAHGIQSILEESAPATDRFASQLILGLCDCGESCFSVGSFQDQETFPASALLSQLHQLLEPNLGQKWLSLTIHGSCQTGQV